jgi:predicted GH43/DUF377 family glycosyl hydrolase
VGNCLPALSFFQMKSVFEQVIARFIPSDQLAPAVRSYNAGLADFGGKRWIAYRQEPDDHFRSKIRMAELCEGAVMTDVAVEVPELTPGIESLEDPRLFLHADGLWLAWTSAVYAGTEWTCRQCYGELRATADGWQVVQALAPRYGRNNGHAKEKNWQFFSAGGRLFAQYSPSKVIEIQGDRVIGEWTESPVPWKWGKPSGGTPPVPYAPGQFITFFHAFEFDPIHTRRYNFGALVFEDRPPFRRISCSATPLVIASEDDPLPAGKIWQPLCIFPCGAVRDGDTWTIAAGVNDERIALLTIPESRLMLIGKEIGQLPPEVTVEVVAPIVHRGEILMPPQTPTLPRSTVRDLLERRKVVLIPQPI